MQKSFLSFSDKFLANTFIGIDDVLDDTIDSFFRSLKIFLYKLRLISIFSTTASTIQSAFLTVPKSSEIFPTLMLLIYDLSNKRGGLELKIMSLAFLLISVFRSSNVTGIFALHNCAAIPPPIVPEPITTTLLIFMKLN